MCPVLPTRCLSVDSKQYGDKAVEGRQDLDPQIWSETKPGVMPQKKAGRPLCHLFHETGLPFLPFSSVTVLYTQGCLVLNSPDCWGG